MQTVMGFVPKHAQTRFQSGPLSVNLCQIGFSAVSAAKRCQDWVFCLFGLPLLCAKPRTPSQLACPTGLEVIATA